MPLLFKTKALLFLIAHLLEVTHMSTLYYKGGWEVCYFFWTVFALLEILLHIRREEQRLADEEWSLPLQAFCRALETWHAPVLALLVVEDS